jgi:putative isomerase
LLRDTTIPLARAWNSWSPRPAEMVFLPLGVRVTPVAYLAHLGRATLFPPGDGISFGEHALDGSHIAMTLAHGGTRLAWAWRKADPFEVCGTWRTEATGEWGLRFWLNLCLSAEGGETVRLVDGAALVKVGTRYVALAASVPPVQVTGHASVEALAKDYEEHGYFHLASRATEAPVLALRFNLEMMQGASVAAAVADDPGLAISRARERAAAPPPAQEGASHTGHHAGALDAIRDVMAWNTVYDEINRRPYTCISRNWNQSKFGGFGVWLDDQFYHALANSLFDAEMARENLAAALANATPQGNLACLVTANDAWIDRTQIPIGAFIVRLLYKRLGDRSLVAAAYDTLRRNHDWWWSARDPLGRGLVSYGSSALGEALYVGTPFGARNESSMDNSPTHDEAAFDPQTRTLTTYDVGLNSLVCFDAECLAFLARVLGRSEDARTLEERAQAHRQRIRTDLWDETRGIFANRLRDGRFVRSVGPTSFFPLICGAASEKQIPPLLRHLSDPASFAGPFPLPSVSRDDPAFADNTYWRGRIWPPLNFIVWHGLRRNGLDEQAGRLAEQSYALFRASWEGARLCPENYNADTGEALDQPDTEGFYGWGVLMPMLGLAAITDVTPWSGWEIVNEGEDVRVGPLQTPAGLVVIERKAGCVTISLGDRMLLSTDVPGRIAHIRLDPGFASLELPAAIPAGCRVVLPAAAGHPITLARIGNIDLTVGPDETILLPAVSGESNHTLTLVYG